jgi:ABC-type phosphate/phosphonate transport system permease subunit
MDLLNQIIPPAVLLLGASNLTRALYGFVPGFADHHARFVPLGLALVLSAVYVAIVFLGPVLRLGDVPPETLQSMDMILFGLGLGFLIASLLVAFRRQDN